jgi:nitric oxide reductase large subunit
MKPRLTAARWLLLCLLLLGVVGMHHTVSAEPHDMMHTSQSMPAPDHEMLHLCMAVITAAAGFLLFVLFLFTAFWPVSVSARRFTVVSRVDRPPGLSGRSLLSSVCVLRL